MEDHYVSSVDDQETNINLKELSINTVSINILTSYKVLSEFRLLMFPLETIYRQFL